MPSESFRRLASCLARGETNDAAELVVERFASRLAGLAARGMSRGLQQRVDPEDVVQSVFATFFRQHHAGKIELRDWESLRGYLAQVAVWRVRRYARRDAAGRRDAGRAAPLAEADAFDREPGPEDVRIAEELREHLLANLKARHPDKYHRIAARILEGAGHAAIAREFDTSITTVERVHARAREFLAKLLADEESGNA
jgi:RNA polymerase sigma-70 factor (ECF subfamily)